MANKFGRQNLYERDRMNDTHGFASQCANKSIRQKKFISTKEHTETEKSWTDFALLLTITAVARRLRYCATNRKVAGSIPDGVTGIFHYHNPSDRTMALRSTQSLTQMSTRIIFLGKKAAGA